MSIKSEARRHQMTMSHYFRQLMSRVDAAFRQNRGAALVLQSVALGIALSYFFIDDTRETFDTIAELKTRFGWQFSAISTAVFGGLVPSIYLYCTNKIRTRIASTFSFSVLFWTYKGIEIDLLYQWQVLIFGAENTLPTVLKKTLVDQLIYSALWAAPSIVLIYLWRDCHYDIGRWWRAQNKDLWTLHIPSVIISNWLIWFPAVAVVYTMPVPLQIPLFNIVLCFFVLMLASLSPESTESAPQMNQTR